MAGEATVGRDETDYVEQFETPARFFAMHEHFWLENEAAHGVFLRLVPKAPPDVICLSVRDGVGGPPVTACFLPGDEIVVSEASEKAAAHLAQYLASREIRVPGIFAPAPAGQRLAACLSPLDGSSFRTAKRLFHWELTQLAPLAPVEGRLRAATRADQDVVSAYRIAMQEEVNTQRPRDQRAAVERELAGGNLFVMESAEGKIVCTGTIDIGRSERCGSVDGIYTAPDVRGRGYASRLTAYLCTLILAERPVVFLSSDADDPGPTRVYEKVGFKVRSEMENLRAVI